MTSSVKEEYIGEGSVDQIRTEATEPSESVHVEGSKKEALSQGAQMQGRVTN